MDDANFFLINKSNTSSLLFQYQYFECFNCLMENVSIRNSNIFNLSIIPNLIVNTLVLQTELNNNESYKVICNDNFTLFENVKYNYSIQNRNNMSNIEMFKCILTPLSPVVDFMLPFYISFAILCLIAILFYTGLMIYRNKIPHKLLSRVFLYQFDSYMDLGNPSNVPPEIQDDINFAKISKSSVVKRVKGVDTFRGLSIVLMIFVNYGGGNYYFMQHSKWNGLTVADLVFPWFVFVMGVTVAFSFYRSTLKDIKKMFLFRFWLQSVRRTIILFIIGIALENPDREFGNLRIMGPLQRLAIAYLCLTTTICMVSVLKNLCKSFSQDLEADFLQSSITNEINLLESSTVFYKFSEIIPDICKCFPYILLIIGFLVSHACISLLVIVPNCPRGYLGPGGIGDHGCCQNCSGGVAGYIDRIILTPNHMYQTPTSQKLYDTSQPFDPEGILGNLTSSALCLIGFWAGNVMLLYRNWTAIIKRLFVYAIVCAGIGVGLCQCRLNEGLIPINKNLWSVSYVLIMAGMSLFLLGFIFVVVDVLHIWSGSPFKYPGMNSIVIYIGHTVMKKTFPVQWKLGLSAYEHVFTLIMNIWGATFWTLISYIMYIKQMYITV